MSGRSRPAAVAVLGAALGVLVVGCGAASSAPSARAPRSVPAPPRHPVPRAAAVASSIPAGVIIAQRTHEYPQPPAAQRVVGGWSSPAAAVRAFALVYSNWTARTVVLRLRTLALVSVGQARSLVTLQAAETAADAELQRGGIANAATLEAIAPQSGGAGRWVVVTQERTTSSRTAAYQGLAPAWHVALATVARVAGGLWVVSGWQPES